MTAIVRITSAAPPTASPMITPFGNVEEGVFPLGGDVFVPVAGTVSIIEDCE